MSRGIRNPKSDRIHFVTMLVKYLVSLVFACLPIITMRSFKYTLVALAELFLIALLTDLLIRRKRLPGCILNNILIVLFNVQMAVLFFSSTFVETIMLSNLDSVEDLQGNAAEYILAVVVIVIASFLPVRAFGKRFRSPKKTSVVLAAAAVVEVLFLTVMGVGYSPFGNYIILLKEEYEIYQLHQIVDGRDDSDADNSTGSDTNLADLFYSDGIADYRQKDALLPDSTNIILIFTEGLSQNVIDDEREIMPNIADFQEESLTFTNYYNHTYATYRGLSGQLYSGYQMDNLDENCLVSIQSVLKDRGYHTVLINTEPNNEEFTDYLNSFGFDEVIGEASDDLLGLADSYSDRQAYELLYDTAQTLSESDEPYFVVIYTFGTHATLTSTDEVFEDGANDELNKFYNLDVQFGSFFERYRENGLSEDTVLVLTTDHATYQDSEFKGAFPDYTRLSTQADEIPLSIYYEGIEPEIIDAAGRNSLDLVPTILDFLDISAPNYFLGDSLFAESSASCCDTVFFADTSPLSSADGTLSNLKGDALQSFQDLVQNYFIFKAADDLEAQSIGELQTGLSWNLSGDGQELEIIFDPGSDQIYEQYRFAVWDREEEGEEGGAEEISYTAYEQEDGSWMAQVSLSDITLHGEIRVNVYGKTEDTENLLEYASILIP